MSSPKKSILITGCSPNTIAPAPAYAFQRANFHVFACIRDPAHITHLPFPKDQILTLDLRSPTSISSVVEIIKVHTAGRGIDILFNAARVEFVMPILDTDQEETERCFEINVLDTLAMTRACMPILREREGMVVNLSSIGALVNTPWLGILRFVPTLDTDLLTFLYESIYAASEAALNTLSETSRLELVPFNVKV